MKRRVSKRRVSKRRVSKRRVSKRRVSKRSKKKMKGGSLYNIAQGVAGVATVAAIYAPRCKICDRIWKGQWIGRDWIWIPGTGNDTTLTGIHFHDFLQDPREREGVCGICNGNNMYNKLISEGKTELTAKIKVIEELMRESKLNHNMEWLEWYDWMNEGKLYRYGQDKVLEQLDQLKELKKLELTLELTYKRLALAKIIEIPTDLYERISYHLTIINE
jgi:hypothetical protein